MNPNHYRIIISDISEGAGEAYEAYVPAFQAHHFGDTIEKAIEAYHAYFITEVERRKKKNIAMPSSDIIKYKTKQVPLRIPEETYLKALDIAKTKHQSFNAFVSSLLEGAVA
ncbi:hypothetical protein IPJ72_04850 [Candidatus Peregrinibacteria bacterium]|nr:MAG: hypothetical protein IPJ72_04850 [Candidatus Peregrinibacteria bacterium]